MSRARGQRSLLAGVFESTEKTAPTSGFFYLPFSQNTLGEARGLLADDVVGKRDPRDHETDNPVVDGDITVPMDVRNIGFWLKGALGAPSTSESTGVFTHVFTTGLWTLPTMSLENGYPDASRFKMHVGCKVDRFRFSAQRNGLLNAVVSVVGQGQKTATSSTGAGTPTERVQKRFVNRQGAISLDGSPFGDVVSFDFDYGNNLDRVETITSDGHIGGLDELNATLALNPRIRYTDDTLIDAATSGTPVSLSYALTISATESLTFTVPRLFLSKPKTPTEGPQGIEQAFEAQASLQTNGNPMMTVTLVNDVASY